MVGGAQISPVNYEQEVRRRIQAEARVRDLEAYVARLETRIAALQSRSTSPGRKPMPREGSPGRKVASSPNMSARGAANGREALRQAEIPQVDDPIDRAICDYLDQNPDFPVSIQKVAPNRYVFGDRGTVYVTQRGDHIVVRVGGGFKSLQVFMDERALMLTGEAAGAHAQQNKH